MFSSWYEKHEKEILKDFFTLLSFPSISTDPQYKTKVKETAIWLKNYLSSFGLKTELWETSGHPVVFASDLSAGPQSPTLLIYHHYDVQPVDPLELWKSDPFKPTVREGTVYARGALDNKGQLFYSVTALRAYLELIKKRKLNIKLFIEGEEESGGKGTYEVLKSKQRELKADHLLVIDGDLPAEGVPGITLGMRGITTLNVEVKNSNIDLHSGMLGGIVLNPNRALAVLLAKLWDKTGRVAVPHFYDQVRKLTDEEEAELDMSFDMERYKKSFGIRAFRGEDGYSLRESNWIRPTCEINGMSGGYTGEGFKTVIPAKAFAKISCRLVPDQDPHVIAELVKEFLMAHVDEGIELKVDFHHGAFAFRSSPDTKIAQVTAQAYEEVFHKKCLRILGGGSVPIVPDLQKASGADALLIGFGLAEDDIHAPNEHFSLNRFKLGFLTIAKILELL